MKRNIKTRQSGFSLVELMVVVAIIGVLASLAVPRFRIFQAKSRQAEAKANLAHFYSLEMSYYGDNDTYVALAAGAECGANNLGFTLANCGTINGPRYNYQTTVASATAFTAQAQSNTGSKANKIWPGCGTADTWTINQQKALTATSDSTKSCAN